MAHITLITCWGTIDKDYGRWKGIYDFHIGDSRMPTVLNSYAYGNNFDHIPLLKKDSLDMINEHRISLRETIDSLESEYIIITHGTDTMIETARALLGIDQKTIILLWSSIPFVFKNSDAEFNIGFAVGWIACLPHGTYIAMGWKFFSPLNVMKNEDGTFSELIS